MGSSRNTFSLHSGHSTHSAHSVHSTHSTHSSPSMRSSPSMHSSPSVHSSQCVQRLLQAQGSRRAGGRRVERAHDGSRGLAMFSTTIILASVLLRTPRYNKQPPLPLFQIGHMHTSHTWCNRTPHSPSGAP